MDYRKALSIDRMSLDIECMKQASLYQEVIEDLANVTFNRDTCKEKLEVLKAEIDSEVRAAPEEYGLVAKPTETAIRNIVICEPRTEAKTKEYLELCRQTALLSGAKGALEHKKSALEMLVKLWGGGYWADPNVKEADKQSYEKEVVEKAENEELNENPRLKRRRNNG